MKIQLADLRTQYLSIQNEIDNAIKTVIDQTDFISGKEVSAFEENFSRFLQVKGTIGVASGTAALQLALLAVGIQPSDEIITTAHTFAATAEAIVHVGGIPIFVDIDPDTYLIDPEKIEEAITSKTKAIIPVHLYGLPAEMARITEIAQKHHLFVIEDAAQAHGAKYHGKACGSLGDLACFSFYPGKNLGAFGDAGAVSGNTDELLDKVKKLRDHGRTDKYMHEIIGYGERLDTLQAAILDIKLKYLADWNHLRQLHAKQYTELLSGLPIILPYVPDGLEHVYHQFVIRTDKRDSLLKFLKANEIGVGIHYPIPLHKQPAFKDYVKQGFSLPVTEKVVQEIISIPIYPELTESKIEFIVSKIISFF